jgi:hypothetical protein
MRKDRVNAGLRLRAHKVKFFLLTLERGNQELLHLDIPVADLPLYLDLQGRPIKHIEEHRESQRILQDLSENPLHIEGNSISVLHFRPLKSWALRLHEVRRDRVFVEGVVAGHNRQA